MQERGAGAARARADASIASDATVVGSGDETPASVETVAPGARLLGGPRGALPQSAAYAALIPGAAPTRLTPEAGLGMISEGIEQPEVM
jgi:hypothetical protein